MKLAEDSTATKPHAEVKTIYELVVKPSIDFVLALIALGLLSPLFLIVIIAIRVDSKGPALFVQERLGRYGKVFRIYKFRSMLIAAPGKGDRKLYEDDPRITKVGRFLRKTSIDELPQLLNIVKGDMSFIGPRPPVPYFPKEYKDYNGFESQRFLVKPGISGLAQTRCREIHDWDINIPIDVEYVQNYSFSYDTRLFLTSLLFFFKTDNIYRKE